MSERRMRHWQSTLDGIGFVSIQCPDVLSAEELRDVQEFAALWLRQLERWSKLRAASLNGKEEK